jgi:hypothetical protein
MALRCNIDARGKRIRLIYGVGLALVGIVLTFAWAIPSGGGALPWTISLIALVSGAFVIFESRTGWCILRAMGFKTPV